MAVWLATATGQDTGCQYVYEVTGPEDATLDQIVRTALAAHGRNLLTGVASEVVHPTVTVTKIAPNAKP